MSPEGHKPSEIYRDLFLIGGILLLSTLAFSRKTRNAIWQRDKGKDQWDGSTENLEAAHINHNKQNPVYDEPSNGRLLKRHNHYLDHYNRMGRNGLTVIGNIAALNLIWLRLTDEEKEGLPPPPEL